MTGPTVRLTRGEATGVAEIIIDNGRLNPLSSVVLGEFADAVHRLESDLPTAVIVRGARAVFSAGADITEFSGPEEAAGIAAAFDAALSPLASLPRITVAAIDGFALGGGFELALACDFRLMADTAKVGLPEVHLGVIPGGGGTRRLPRLVGRQKALALLLSGRQVESAEALRLGLIDEVVPGEELLDRARELAHEHGSGALVAKGMIKRAVDAGCGDPENLESELFSRVFATEDAQQGLKSFREKGPGHAEFRGR